MAAPSRCPVPRAGAGGRGGALFDGPAPPSHVLLLDAARMRMGILHWALLDPTAEIERTGDTLRLGGDIDLRNLARVRTLLGAALADGVRRLDLSDLRFCCVAGLAALARIADGEDDPQGGVVLVDPSYAVSRVLELIRRR